MIGLGSSITSGVPESKYSASFDGTDDSIDTNQNFTSTFNNSFSISFWMKPTDGQPGSSEYLFGVVDGSSNPDDACQLELLTDGKLKFSFEADTDTFVITTDNEIFSNGAASSWTHVLISMTKNASGNSSADFFINGVDVDNTISNNMTVANHANFNSTKNLVIGARNERGTIQDFYDGGIDEFGIYNIALDDGDVITKIYNNGVPKNLTLIDEDGINDNLQLYYRMGDGFFDDKANGAIHDQTNPGLGNNLVVNGTFSADSNWTKTENESQTDPGTFSSLTINNSSSGVAELTVVNSAYVKISQTLTYTSGKVYKITATINGTNAKRIRFRDSTGNNGGLTTTNGVVTMTGSSQNVELYFIANANSAAVHVERHDAGNYSFTVDDVSLQELNSIPGITSGGTIFSSDTP